MVLVLSLQFIVFLSFFAFLNGSAGDMDFHFQHCVSKCSTGCAKSIGTPTNNIELAPLIAELTYPYSFIRWSCQEQCSYGCMTFVTANREKYGYGPMKYNGHWPFRRWFGIEELASSGFSALNAIPHLYWLYNKYLSRVETNSVAQPIQLHLIAYCMFALLAWLASTIYHAKKTPESTNFDLCSALCLVCTGMLIPLQLFLLGFGNRRRVSAIRTALPLISYSLVAWRVLAMLSGDISFQKHMTTCISLVSVTTLLWFGWIIRSPFVACRRYCILVQLWFIAASLLELFDFPPYWRIFDAHSLWHAATVPLGFLWYRFWDEFSNEYHSKEKKKEKLDNE